MGELGATRYLGLKGPGSFAQPGLRVCPILLGTFPGVPHRANPATADVIQVPPTLTQTDCRASRRRTRTFGSTTAPATTTNVRSQPSSPARAARAPKGIGTDTGRCSGRIWPVSAAPRWHTRETWTLKKRGATGIIPFTSTREGQIPPRTENRENPVPIHRQSRGGKDVYRLTPRREASRSPCSSGTGEVHEHCHKHDAMRTTPGCCVGRSTIRGPPFPGRSPTPIPTPQGGRSKPRTISSEHLGGGA